MHGLVWLLTMPILASAASPEEVQNAVKAALSDRSIQRSFPVLPVMKEPDPPSTLQTDGGEVAELLLWILVGAVVLLLLVWLTRNLSRPKGTTHSEEPEEDLPDSERLTDATLSEADRLAAEGRFEEATHTLLQASLVRLDKRAAIPMSMTSREVLRSATLTEPGRGALKAMIVLVERSHFGDATLDADGYARARAHCIGLADAEGWSRTRE